MDFEKVKKLFIDWTKKKILHHVNKKDREIYFREKEVWWAALGQNIGLEIGGKHELFERPVLIIRKYNEDTCFIVPFTSRIKDPVPWYQILADFGVEKSAANITQGRTISSKRLLRREATLDNETYDKIVLAFKGQFKEIGI